MAPDARAYPTLFSPVALGPVILKNRISIPAHTMLLGEFDGTVGARYRAYLVERARGGAALISLESAPVNASSLTFPQQIRLWEPRVAEGLGKVSSALHSQGAKFAAMLWHGGRNVPYQAGRASISASAVPSLQTGDTPREATLDDIREIVTSYREAARNCVAGGVDAIEVQTASDYLLGAFLSPRLNRRRDSYGGSAANRVRLVVEILEAIRREIGPNIAIGVRTSIAHQIPLDSGGYGPAESMEVMQLIANSGLVDYVSLMTGSNGALQTVIPPMTARKAEIADLSRAFRQELSVPVIATGRITTPEEAESVLATGAADLVGIVRAFIAEPHWGSKAEGDQADRIRPCMGCNQSCLGFANRMIPAGCTINPSAGLELAVPVSPPAEASVRRRVAVVGGGPAGMEAARTAATRGHAVTLYEASDRLGGAFRLAAEAPHRAGMLPALDWWRRELQELEVDVRLNTPVLDPGSLTDDAVIWATGAASGWSLLWRNRPQLTDGIPGAASLPHCREVLAGTARVAGDVLVVDEDGGWPTVSLVESLVRAEEVRQLTVITSAMILGAPELSLTAELAEVSGRLAVAGVRIVAGTFVASASGSHVAATDGRQFGPYDAIVLSMGAVSARVPAGVTPTGDCVAPRGIWAAVQDGARAGLQV
jgi:2,4-dienoyl-CoA reductase-like NADH-dependent reductase (Old Yellow Enzyme family)